MNFPNNTIFQAQMYNQTSVSASWRHICSWVAPHIRRLVLPTPCQVRNKRQLEILLFKITVDVTVLFNLQPGGHVAKRPLGKTIIKPSAIETMGKRKTTWRLPGTQSICSEFSGRSFTVATLFLGTCLCLHCLLLDSELLKDGDPPYSYP